jgi:nitrate reductase gamma subunit
MYDFITGPLVIITGCVFVAGVLRRTAGLIVHTKKIINKNAPVFLPDSVMAVKPVKRRGHMVKRMMVRLKKFLYSASAPNILLILLFHILVVMLPFTINAHAVLMFQTFHIRVPAFSDGTGDILTIALLVLLVLLFARRLFFSEIRCISRVKDYMLLVVAMMPFLFGMLSYRQVGDYTIMMYAHILSAHVFIAVLGWTKLGHMLFLLFARVLIRGENGLSRGYLRWGR